MTIVGWHTVAELGDFLKAKDVEMGVLRKTYDSLTPDLRAKDPTLGADLEALEKRYALGAIPAKLRLNQVPAIAAPYAIAEVEWNGILRALKKNPEMEAPTDAGGVMIRLMKLTTIAPYTVPQPKPGSDVDFEILKGTTKITTAIENQAPAKNPLPYLYVGAGLAVLAVLVLRK